MLVDWVSRPDMHLMWAKLPNHVVLNTEPSSWPLSVATKSQVKLLKWLSKPLSCPLSFSAPYRHLCPFYTSRPPSRPPPPPIDVHPVLAMPRKPPHPLGRKACANCTRRHRSCDLDYPCENCKTRNIPCVAQSRNTSQSHSCALPPDALTIFTYSPV